MLQTVAIVGATGLQGGSVLRTLHATGQYKIVALTRNTSSTAAVALKERYPDVEVVAADVDDTGSLKEAFATANIVFGMTSFVDPELLDKISNGQIDAEFVQGKNIADAAIASGVDKIVFSTLPSLKAHSGGKYPGAYQFEAKHDIETYLNSKSDEIQSAFVHLGSYMENFIKSSRISPDDNETVVFSMPLPPTYLSPFVDVANDTGPVVLHVLDHFDEFSGESIVVSGGFYKMQDMVDAFSEVTGRPAKYVQSPMSQISNNAVKQMFATTNEFGSYANGTNFVEQNKQMAYKHTTPVEFWRNRGWAGPSK
ncbi:hypothetical protein LPJ59_002839 [Coemansia sp. RSA 2399]|nr:hypothetical protein LPJ59_002839 [Coemansia sp. RSA 2399]KAJ1904462.1 hypothetical protein LPJ81_002482 [Coemansia sp. IMI 209127]